VLIEVTEANTLLLLHSLSDNAKLQQLWFGTWWRLVPHTYVTSGRVTWTVPTVSSACGWAWATSKILLFPRTNFKSRNLLTKSTFRASQFGLIIHPNCRSNIQVIRKETIDGPVFSDTDPYWEGPGFNSRSQLWLSWLSSRRHAVVGRGFDYQSVIGVFHWHNPSGRTMAMGSTQLLAEMSTGNISCGEGGKGGRCVGLTNLSLLCTDCLEIWETSRTLRACNRLAHRLL